MTSRYERICNNGFFNEQTINVDDNHEEQELFRKLFREQHAERFRMQQQLMSIGINFEIRKIDVDFCDTLDDSSFDVGVSVLVRLTSTSFGNSHENIGYGASTHWSSRIALLQAKHFALQSAVERGVRMFRE
jgi:hypothetical protein